MNAVIKRKSGRERRLKRVRSHVRGTPERPRVSVFRSNKHIYVQLIDDTVGHTLVAASDDEVVAAKATKTEVSRAVGKALAGKARKAGITRVVFDRGPYKYHGRVKALAEGLREGGVTI